MPPSAFWVWNLLNLLRYNPLVTPSFLLYAHSSRLVSIHNLLRIVEILFMLGEVTTYDLENSLPYWIVDHLEDYSFMEIEVKNYPISPKEHPAKPVGDPPIFEDARPLPEK